MADLIDRAAAIDALSYCDFTKTYKDETALYKDSVIYELEQLPSIEERMTGKWIEDRVIPDAYDITGEKTWASVMRCDNCGFTMFSIEGHMGQYNFCPNCGAKMEGDGDA